MGSATLESWIREERLKRRLSQAKMAKLLGLPPAAVSGWETGKIFLTEEKIKSLRKFFAGFDADVTAGKISLEKRRFLRKYDLSTNGVNVSKNGKTPGILETDFSVDRLRVGDVHHIDRSLPAGNGPKAIALFSGIGGMTLGFEAAGFRVLGHVEIDPTLRLIYEANFSSSTCLGHDVKTITRAEILEWKRLFGAIDVLFGGPPCQGFSLAGKRNHLDPRNELFNDFVRIASILKPKAILMENVRMLLSMKASDGASVASHVVDGFRQAGYHCAFKAVNAQDYGVPQFRQRVLFIGIRTDVPHESLEFPKITHSADACDMFPGIGLSRYRTFRDATGDLESLESGEKSMRDPWHFAIVHPDHVIEMLKSVSEGKSAHENIDSKLRPSSGYNTTYKRLRWDEPASTISTNFSMISGSRNVHPVNTRSLTIREAMRCQTFPDDFKLIGKLGAIRMGIGNAVPPLLARQFAKHLAEIISAIELETAS